MLIPFTLFLYENDLQKINTDNDKLASLLKVYEKIIRMLSEEETKGDITFFQKREIINLLNNVTDELAKKYENVVKGVKVIMGGQILKFPDTEAYKKGKSEGCKEGRVEGRIEGEVYGRIDLLHEEKKSNEAIILNIKNKFNLSDEQAKKYFSDWEKLSDIQEA